MKKKIMIKQQIRDPILDDLNSVLNSGHSNMDSIITMEETSEFLDTSREA
jgi:hypothetical protein